MVLASSMPPRLPQRAAKCKGARPRGAPEGEGRGARRVPAARHSVVGLERTERLGSGLYDIDIRIEAVKPRRVGKVIVGNVRRPSSNARGRGKPEVLILFDVVDNGPATDIARDKDRMIAKAVRQERERKTAGKLQSRPAAARPRQR
ncbi:MAG TPA: hypothetical protein VHX61_18620 [Rhizomicrobium sp.]|jgi:hypothetical protein|nr:hypothetical protein [Rhizomicrobium sp.]